MKKMCDPTRTVASDENDVFNLDALRAEISKEDAFICDLVDTIPPKFYFDQEVQEKLTADKHASMDEAAKGIKRKPQELTAKTKHKRARLDPQQHKLVSQVQREMEQDKRPRVKKGVISSSATLTRAANVQELQKRLQERIKELQGKRKTCSVAETQEKKRLKRKMQKVKKRQKGNLKKPITNDHQNAENKNKKQPKQTVEKEAKPVYNKDGNILYSKFQFSESGEEPLKKKRKKGKKNLKKLIENVEKDKQKIESVKETNPAKANELIQKSAWQRAIQKAEGIKVRDDPTLLKKSLKKQEKVKTKSSKEWKKRVEHTDKVMKAKQDKRKKNIQHKKREKLDKKIKKAKKKGRIIPGF